MPYYQCPKCSGRDTYEGTELVSGSKGGGAIIGPENDLGFSPVVGTGGSKTIDQVTVVKCKKCDIILGDKDIRYSQEEIDRSKVQEVERIKKREEDLNSLLIAVVIIITIVAIIVTMVAVL